MGDEIVVIKLNTEHQETWRYTGKVLFREPHALQIEAYFNREDIPFHGLLLKKGDRFVEVFYDNLWYNIFEMHDRDDDQLKGWYCNICLPSEFEPAQVRYVDLALDLLVFPDGRQLVLDEDEFAALDIPLQTRKQALSALDDLRSLFRGQNGGSLRVSR